MAKRITERQRLALKLDNLNDSEVREILDYISIMESMRRAATLPGLWEDELVRSWPTRARTSSPSSFEWEAVRRRAERHAAVAARV